jgi:hypothetical protein
MRSEDDIANKVTELYHKHLCERQDKYLSVCPLNCNWNKRHRVKGQNEVGFCRNEKIITGTKNSIFICNEVETAEKCQHYECKHTDVSVKADFDSILKNPAHCGQEYPKLAVLIWVLQKEVKQGSRKERFKKLFIELWELFTNIITLKWW